MVLVSGPRRHLLLSGCYQSRKQNLRITLDKAIHLSYRTLRLVPHLLFARCPDYRGPYERQTRNQQAAIAVDNTARIMDSRFLPRPCRNLEKPTSKDPWSFNLAYQGHLANKPGRLPKMDGASLIGPGALGSLDLCL